jgi:hypothetical protein
MGVYIVQVAFHHALFVPFPLSSLLFFFFFLLLLLLLLLPTLSAAEFLLNYCRAFLAQGKTVLVSWVSSNKKKKKKKKSE